MPLHALLSESKSESLKSGNDSGIVTHDSGIVTWLVFGPVQLPFDHIPPNTESLTFLGSKAMFYSSFKYF